MSSRHTDGSEWAGGVERAGGSAWAGVFGRVNEFAPGRVV